jgi:sec-independent protein translocase protein TatA
MFEGLFRPMHLVVIFSIALIVFGTGKLSEIGGQLGKAIREFKKSMHEFYNLAPPAEAKKADFEKI